MGNNRLFKSTFIFFVCMASLLASCISAASDGWSGSYMGATLGARSIDADWKTTRYQDPDSADIPFGTNPSETIGTKTNSLDIFGGMNWLSGPNVVFGVEGRLGYASKATKHRTIPGVAQDDPPDFSFVEITPGLQASVRGRLGFLVTPRTHLYGTLGLTALQVEITATCPADTDFCNPVDGTQSKSETSTLTGWTASVGVETLLSDTLFFRFDYSYDDYGSTDFSGLPPLVDESFGFASKVGFSGNVITAGVGYRF